MSPDDALERLGSRRRQYATMAVSAFMQERFGGWVGKYQELIRFLAHLGLCRQKHLMSEGLFDENWPHHEAGSWPWGMN